MQDIAANSSMKGISLIKAGGPENLKYDDVAMPELADGQVMIEVYASALNGADLLQRAGNYPQPPGTGSPAILCAHRGICAQVFDHFRLTLQCRL